MRKAVIICLDAFFRADIERLPAGHPLARFLADSAVCPAVKTVFPSLTYPAHVTLMTGCDPDRTGVGQNQPYQPGLEAPMRAWYWEAADVKVPTLLDRVKYAGGRCASILWPVTGKNRSIRWNFPEVLALPGENQVLKMLRYGTPLWILKMEVLHGKKRVSTKEPHLSDYAALLCRELVKHQQPDLTLVHLVDLDEARHHNGTFSEEAQNAIDRLGQRVESVWQTMQQTPGMEDALLILVSDHGQDDLTQTVSLRRVLTENGFPDVGVQSCGMSAYLMAGSRTQEVSEWLNAHPQQAGIQHVYTREELNAMHCVAMPDLAVEAAAGVVFSDELEIRKREKATHGFGPQHPATECLFAVRGKGIRAGSTLSAMPMRDVAPTVAELMGITMGGCDGVSHAKDIVNL